jgi:hypothetical protein
VRRRARGGGGGRCCAARSRGRRRAVAAGGRQSRPRSARPPHGRTIAVGGSEARAQRSRGAEARDQLVDPAPGDPMRLGELSRTAPLEEYGVHHITTQPRSSTPAERGCPLCLETSVLYVVNSHTLSPAKSPYSNRREEKQRRRGPQKRLGRLSVAQENDLEHRVVDAPPRLATPAFPRPRCVACCRW